MITWSELEALARRLDALELPDGPVQGPAEGGSPEAMARQAKALRALETRLVGTAQRLGTLAEGVSGAIAALDQACEQHAAASRSEWHRMLAPEPPLALRQARDQRLADVGLASAGWYDPEFGQVRLLLVLEQPSDGPGAAGERRRLAQGLNELADVLVPQEHDEDDVPFQVYTVPGHPSDPEEELEFWFCPEPGGDRQARVCHVVSRLYGIPRPLAAFESLERGLTYLQSYFAQPSGGSADARQAGATR